MDLSLNDLIPQESSFELSEKPGIQFTLKKVTLRHYNYLIEKYGADTLNDILSNGKIIQVSEIVFYLLKDTNGLKDVGEFQDLVVLHKDRIAMMNALIKSIGVSQPLIDKLSKEFDEKKSQITPPIGEQSTMQSPPNTTTQ